MSSLAWPAGLLQFSCDGPNVASGLCRPCGRRLAAAPCVVVPFPPTIEWAFSSLSSAFGPLGLAAAAANLLTGPPPFPEQAVAPCQRRASMPRAPRAPRARQLPIFCCPAGPPPGEPRRCLPLLTGWQDGPLVGVCLRSRGEGAECPATGLLGRGHSYYPVCGFVPCPTGPTALPAVVAPGARGCGTVGSRAGCAAALSWVLLRTIVGACRTWRVPWATAPFVPIGVMRSARRQWSGRRQDGAAQTHSGVTPLPLLTGSQAARRLRSNCWCTAGPRAFSMHSTIGNMDLGYAHWQTPHRDPRGRTAGCVSPSLSLLLAPM